MHIISEFKEIKRRIMTWPYFPANDNTCWGFAHNGRCLALLRGPGTSCDLTSLWKGSKLRGHKSNNSLLQLLWYYSTYSSRVLCTDWSDLKLLSPQPCWLPWSGNCRFYQALNRPQSSLVLGPGKLLCSPQDAAHSFLQCSRTPGFLRLSEGGLRHVEINTL